MYYFIPSWYNGNRKWFVETPLWFRVFERMSFDDTINQIQMFQAAHEEAALILTCYHPQLRYYLHKQGLLDVNYWSFFDDIQNIQRKETKTIPFKELGWPEGTRFIYSPFMVLAYVDNEKIADIHFAENGNLHFVIFYEENKEARRYYFDDRGFLSSIQYSKDGVPSYQDYLNEFGVWQVREHLTRKHSVIEINPSADQMFHKLTYDAWEELFKERVQLLKSEWMEPDDFLVVASDLRHNDLIFNNFGEYRKVFSLFGDRFDVKNTEALKLVIEAASLVIIDTEAAEQQILAEIEQHQLPHRFINRVTPFDTRLRLGHSQTIKELIIYFLIDGIDQTRYRLALDEILGTMMENPLIELHLISYENGRKKEQVTEEVLQIINENYSLERFTDLVENESENLLEEDEEIELTAIQFKHFTNENQIIKELDTTRLVIDLSEKPHIYTQIASISAGLPQINMIKTEYVTHSENGWIVDEVSGISEAICYYFDGLSNWNNSLIYTVQKMGDYTSGKIIAHWKELLESKNETIADRG
ncbi:accessory Sec system protein Asp1 [Streptococcus suis]|uniref:accessory Sec system protein Asp1 n=1 Tax=Streptococcus suis TaxID=1307 RepID=UPI002412D7C8|nr:accessory Sec system protein Asp1 [Streptococcus suis]MDG4506608.1 accessory Sec system protein Asp1 [Streptococcus suis]